jgi:hypothetical protein
MNTMNKKIIGSIVVLVVVAGGSFMLGKMSGGAKSVARNGQFSAGQLAGTSRGSIGARAGGGMTVGQVLSVDSGSMTLQMADGSTKIVLLGDSTMVEKTIPGTSADLTKSTPISVIGSVNSDGSITASSVQIRSASTTRPQ